jgi:hypothetical protein
VPSGRPPEKGHLEFPFLFWNALHNDNETQQRVIFENFKEDQECDMLDAEISEEEIIIALIYFETNLLHK